MLSASPSKELSRLRVVLGSLNFVRTIFLKSAPGNREIRAIHRALVLVSSSTNSSLPHLCQTESSSLENIPV